MLRHNFDLKNAPARLLTCGYFIAAGAAAAALSDKVAFAPAIAAIASLASDVAAADIHRRIVGRLGRDERVLRNHDLTRAVGDAIGVAIGNATLEPKLAHAEAKLVSLRKAAPDAWVALVNAESELGAIVRSEAAGLLEERLPQLIAVRPDQFAQVRVLDPPTWRALIGAIADRAAVSIDPPVLKRLSDFIHDWFPSALREVLKHDFEQGGKAYAGMEMLVWGELLATMKQVELDGHERHGEIVGLLEQLLTKLEATTSAHHIGSGTGVPDSELGRGAAASSSPRSEPGGWNELPGLASREDYLQRASTHHGLARIQSGGYVDQQARALTGEPLGTALELLVSAINAPGSQFLLILADYGCGKTSLVKASFVELLTRLESGGELRPVLVNLARWRSGESILDRLLTDLRALSEGVTAARLLDLITDGHLVLFLDGFDEIPDAVTERDLAMRLRELRALARGNGKVFVTSRAHFFTSDRQVEAFTLGPPWLEQEPATDNCRIAYLLDFDPGAIAAFVRHDRPEAEAEWLLGRIQGHPELADLAKRPLLLSMMVHVLLESRSLRSEVSGDGIGVFDLFSTYVSGWFDYQADRGVLSSDQRRSFCEEVALRMAREQQPLMTEDQLRELLREQGHEDANPRDIAAASLDVRTVALLVRDAIGRYGFSHRSFSEYFLATRLARMLPSVSEWPQPLSEGTFAFLAAAVARLPSDEISAIVRVCATQTEPRITGILCRTLMSLSTDQVLAAVQQVGPLDLLHPAAKDLVWAISERARVLGTGDVLGAAVTLLKAVMRPEASGEVLWAAAFGLEKLDRSTDPIALLRGVREHRWSIPRLLESLEWRDCILAAIELREELPQNEWYMILRHLTDVAVDVTQPTEARYNATWILGYEARHNAEAGTRLRDIRVAIRRALEVERTNYLQSNLTEVLAAFHDPEDWDIFQSQVVRPVGVYFRAKIHALHALWRMDPKRAKELFRHFEPVLDDTLVLTELRRLLAEDKLAP